MAGARDRIEILLPKAAIGVAEYLEHARPKGDPVGMPVERADIGSHGSPGVAKVTPAGRAVKYFYRYWYFIVPLTILLQGCVSHITLPGLYMDAVNPDYMIVRLLNWNSHIYSFALPGTVFLAYFQRLSKCTVERFHTT
jgi:hypothetical protein